MLKVAYYYYYYYYKMSSVNIAKILEAMVHHVARHQTHAMIIAACGHVTHCGPLIIFRVVDSHVSKVVIATPATCSGSPMVQG